MMRLLNRIPQIDRENPLSDGLRLVVLPGVPAPAVHAGGPTVRAAPLGLARRYVQASTQYSVITHHSRYNITGAMSALYIGTAIAGAENSCALVKRFIISDNTNIPYALFWTTDHKFAIGRAGATVQGYYQTSATVTDGARRVAMVTVPSGDMADLDASSFYFNGRAVGSEALFFTGDADPVTGNDADVNLGYWTLGAPQHMNGVVEMIAVWDRALTAREAWEMYAHPLQIFATRRRVEHLAPSVTPRPWHYYAQRRAA